MTHPVVQFWLHSVPSWSNIWSCGPYGISNSPEISPVELLSFLQTKDTTLWYLCFRRTKRQAKKCCPSIRGVHGPDGDFFKKYRRGSDIVLICFVYVTIMASVDTWINGNRLRFTHCKEFQRLETPEEFSSFFVAKAWRNQNLRSRRDPLLSPSIHRIPYQGPTGDNCMIARAPWLKNQDS